MKNINKIVNKPIIIKTNFESIRIKLGNSKVPGFTSGIGYIAINLLLADYMKFRTFSTGTVSENSFSRSGYLFVDITDKSRGTSAFMNYCNFFKKINLELCYPVGGCSEVITTKIINQTEFKFVASSCQTQVIPTGDNTENNCMTCYKCFRKMGMNGKLIPIEKIKNKLEHRPLKVATSTIYAAKKNGFIDSNILKEYKNIDVQFLERYYPPYISENSDKIYPLVPNYLQGHIKEMLNYYGIMPMTDSDITKFKNIGDYLYKPYIIPFP